MQQTVQVQVHYQESVNADQKPTFSRPPRGKRPTSIILFCARVRFQTISMTMPRCRQWTSFVVLMCSWHSMPWNDFVHHGTSLTLPVSYCKTRNYRYGITTLRAASKHTASIFFNNCLFSLLWSWSSNASTVGCGASATQRSSVLRSRRRTTLSRIQRKAHVLNCVVAAHLPHMSLRSRTIQHPMTTRSKGDVDAEPDPPSEDKFFKAAWPDISRNKEPAILDEAHRRADELLQEPLRSYVKDHIPMVDAWEELSDTSTALIRCLLGLSTENGQVQLWMICPILEPARKLAPQAFWVALWEAIRCHYIPWRIGVAHGDISLSNIMYRKVTGKCILNDYDLATLMDPGTEVPDRKGYECTGTRPFMALDLLQAEDVTGHTQRRYRHDLESFCWVLVWVGACIQDGQEKLTGHYEKMAMGTHDDVYKNKLALLDDLAMYATTEDYAGLRRVILFWMLRWVTFRENQKCNLVFPGHIVEEKAEYFINDCLVDSVRKAKVPNVDVPVEIDWLSVEVSEFMWRRYRQRHALCGDSE